MNEITSSFADHSEKESPKRRFTIKKVFFISTGIFSSFIILFLMLILSLRWINPSFTAFTLQEDWEKLEVERYSLTEYWVDEDQLPINIKWAVIASEDQRFWEHNGLDFEAIEKAFQENKSGERVRGASTISQQVAKNLFFWGGRSYFRKGLEAVTTLTIEAFWPKDRVLEVYLNIAEFGPGVYGIGKGSEYFFGKKAFNITDDEAARFAAVLPNPKRMRVEPPTPYVAERKDWILRNMKQLSGIAFVPSNIEQDASEIQDFTKDSLINRIQLKDLQPKMWIPVSDSLHYKLRIDSAKVDS
ncbi:MAG: monofunctional biosynthetic peptidoglycan transglycosylase [Balneolaceae bacterium]